MVLHHQSPHGSPGCPCSTSCSHSRQDTWGRRAAEVEAGAEEVAGGVLYPTLVTACSGPSQTQQRLLVPLGPAPGLSLKVLPTQGHAVTALPRQLSSLQLSFPAPAQFLPEAGCPPPFRAQSRLCLSCSHHRWWNATKKKSGLGFFFCSGQKIGPSISPVPASKSSDLLSYFDLRCWW